MEIPHAIAGLGALLALSWALSEDRRGVRWRVVIAGLALQALLAALLLLVPWLRAAVFSLNTALQVLERATQAGTSFVFGYLAGGSAPFDVTHPQSSFVLAFRALPLVIVVSALSALLFHWRILPVVVRAFAWVLEKSMGLGGAVGLSAAANVFVGMVEAPLVVKPYLARLTRAELFIVMVVRDGHHRRHRDGPVRRDPRARRTRRHRPHPDRLDRVGAGRGDGRRADGARPHDPRGGRGASRVRTRARWTPSPAARSRAWGC